MYYGRWHAYTHALHIPGWIYWERKIHTFLIFPTSGFESLSAFEISRLMSGNWRSSFSTALYIVAYSALQLSLDNISNFLFLALPASTYLWEFSRS
jgi:hypothetical protein